MRMTKLKKKKIESILRGQDDSKFVNDSFCFLPGNRKPIDSAGRGLFGAIQDLIKRWGWLYYFLINVFAPVTSSLKYRRLISNTIKKFDEKRIILNIGSGPTYLSNRRDIINVDIFRFREVDIVADAANLPIEDSSVDLIINTAMLEHVENPGLVAEEMYRILRKEGEMICFLPFIQPFHAAPDDYLRWSIEGTRRFFSKFDKLEVGIAAGPTSGMLWVLQEWISIILSFGSKSIHDLIIILLMVTTWPIKIIDLVVVKFPYAEKISSGFYAYVKK